jgi:hypothetical protein
MTTGSSWNGRWQASGPAPDRLRSSFGWLLVTRFPQRRHCTQQPLPERPSAYFRAHPHYPCPGLARRALYAPGYDIWGTFSLVRHVHGNGLRSRERRFESYRGHWSEA